MFSYSKKKNNEYCESSKILFQILLLLFNLLQNSFLFELYLPHLIEKDGCILRKVLPKQDVDFIINVYEKYNYEDDITENTMKDNVSTFLFYYKHYN